MLLVTYVALYIFGNIITALLKNYYLLFIILYFDDKHEDQTHDIQHTHTQTKRNKQNETKHYLASETNEKRKQEHGQKPMGYTRNKKAKGEQQLCFKRSGEDFERH